MRPEMVCLIKGLCQKQRVDPSSGDVTYSITSGLSEILSQWDKALRINRYVHIAYGYREWSLSFGGAEEISP